MMQLLTLEGKVVWR